MGFFSSKKKTYVGGGMSRIRPDELIHNSSGLVAIGAIQSGTDVTEAILLNEMSGTKSSYKSWFRRTADSIGLPEVHTTSFLPNLDLISAAVRSSIGQSYPTTAQIYSVSLNNLTDEVYFQELAQRVKDYNIETNTLVHNSFNYMNSLLKSFRYL